MIFLDPTYDAFRNVVSSQPRKNLAYYLKRLSQLSQKHLKPKAVPSKKTEAQLADILQADVSNTSLAEMATAWRLQRVAYRKYVPHGIFQGKISLILTEYRISFGLERYRNWHKLATQGIQMQVIPGHHNDILKDPSVKVLATKIQSLLDLANQVNHL